ncbi:hypothetical protein CDAR_283931 [Caerostris darwini]|uniref:Uncharacterized protein n=1 Tax=Caerostris darwini TaxID=1538125 RepID=A0AAV4PI00_9ARAC|nr:hypothetical protein CDAR_283931 [Caerostris darwini]
MLWMVKANVISTPSMFSLPHLLFMETERNMPSLRSWHISPGGKRQKKFSSVEYAAGRKRYVRQTRVSCFKTAKVILTRNKYHKRKVWSANAFAVNYFLYSSGKPFSWKSHQQKD